MIFKVLLIVHKNWGIISLKKYCFKKENERRSLSICAINWFIGKGMLNKVMLFTILCSNCRRELHSTCNSVRSFYFLQETIVSIQTFFKPIQVVLIVAKLLRSHSQSTTVHPKLGSKIRCGEWIPRSSLPSLANRFIVGSHDFKLICVCWYSFIGGLKMLAFYRNETEGHYVTYIAT